ncbi:hypothetical protein D3C84_462140 [compost metagenome]
MGCCDAVVSQFVFRADSRLHEHFGCLHCAHGQDDLGCGIEALSFACDHHLDTDCPCTGQQHAGNQCSCQNRQILVVQPWTDVGVVNGVALAMFNAQVGNGDPARAFHHFSIRTVESGDSQAVGRLQRCPREGLGWRRLFDMHRATRTTPSGIRDALPVLDSAVVIEYRIVAPGRVAGLGSEMVPIGAVAA